MIRNYTEAAVNDLLLMVLEEYKHICKCSICLDDIKARTLNRLRPLYFVEEKGDVRSKLNELSFQFRAEVIKELVHSIEIVSENPSHSL
jgi:competence protein ComFB